MNDEPVGHYRNPAPEVVRDASRCIICQALPYADETNAQTMARLAWARVHELEDRLVQERDRRFYEARISELEGLLEKANRRRSA